MNSDLTNLAGLSRHLNLPRQWLEQEVAAGRIPYLKVGCKKRFSIAAVEAVLAKRAGEKPEGAQ